MKIINAKNILLTILITCSGLTHSLKEQQDGSKPLLHPALSYLVGNWRLTESLESERIPPIEMKTIVADDGRGIIVNLHEKNEKGEWEVIMVEYMLHDDVQDKIHVLWSNRGQVGKGLAEYNTKTRQLSSVDTNMQGEVTLSVVFDFIDDKKYKLSGFDPEGKKLWAFIYEKM